MRFGIPPANIPGHLHNKDMGFDAVGNAAVFSREPIPGPDDGAPANRHNLAFVGTDVGLFAVRRNAEGAYQVGMLEGDPAFLNDPLLQERVANWNANNGLENPTPVNQGGGGAVCRPRP